MPGMPDMAGIPDMAGMPDMPDMAGMPDMPGMLSPVTASLGMKLLHVPVLQLPKPPFPTNSEQVLHLEVFKNLHSKVLTKISEQGNIIYTRTIIVHRSVDGILIVINIYSVRPKDGKKSRRKD